MVRRKAGVAPDSLAARLPSRNRPAGASNSLRDLLFRRGGGERAIESAVEWFMQERALLRRDELDQERLS